MTSTLDQVIFVKHIMKKVKNIIIGWYRKIFNKQKKFEEEVLSGEYAVRIKQNYVDKIFVIFVDAY